MTEKLFFTYNCDLIKYFINKLLFDMIVKDSLCSDQLIIVSLLLDILQ